MDMSTNVESGKAATKSFDDRDVGKNEENEQKETVVETEYYGVWMNLAKFFHMLLGNRYYPAFKGAAGVSGIGAMITLAGLFNFGHESSSIATLASRTQYLIPFFACSVVLCLALYMMAAPSDSACPICKEPFRMFDEELLFVDKVQLEDQAVRNYQVLKKCNKCGCKKNYPYIEKDYFSSSSEQ